MEKNLSPRVAALAARHLGVQSTEMSVAKMAGDASTRSYFRASGAGSSVVIAVYGKPFDEREPAENRLARLETEDPAARLYFANDPCAHIEVTEMFLEAGLPVPRILEASGSDAALIIEDLGDTRLQDWMAGRSEKDVVSAYRQAVDLVVKIQSVTSRAVETGSVCARLAFDEAKLGWELEFFVTNYFDRYLGLQLDRATAGGVASDFGELCRELAARPRVLVHRDYHARNLMVWRDRLFMIDHQDARLGPASYDVASLLADPYAALESGIAGDLLEHFVELRAESGASARTLDDFRLEYQLMTIQRLLKAAGTYSHQAAALDNEVYLPYIAPAIEGALAGMAAANRFDHARALLERTSRMGPGRPGADTRADAGPKNAT